MNDMNDEYLTNGEALDLRDLEQITGGARATGLPSIPSPALAVGDEEDNDTYDTIMCPW